MLIPISEQVKVVAFARLLGVEGSAESIALRYASYYAQALGELSEGASKDGPTISTVPIDK